jgi:hypothetical protein
MPTVIPLFTCVDIDYTSKMGGACLCLADAGIWSIFLKLLRMMYIPFYPMKCRYYSVQGTSFLILSYARALFCQMQKM